MASFKENRSASILISILCYVMAVFVAIWSVRLFNVDHPLAIIAIGDLAATIFIFLCSMAFNNSSMYDPYWSVKPAVIATYYFINIPIGDPSTIQWLVLILAYLYAVRLTWNFYRSWPGLIHEDWRYMNFRKQFPKLYWVVSFLGIHFFPSVMVFLGCLPMFGIFSGAEAQCYMLIGAGLLLTLFAIVLAEVADQQLLRFRSNPENKGKIINTGMWRISRHPNYLGEILTWWGFFLVVLGYSTNYWWTGIGALTITVMFVFISIPLIEKRASKNKPNFADYKKATSVLIPFKF